MWKITKIYSHISCKTYRKLAQVNYPKQNYPATEHMCSKEEFENHLRRLCVFFLCKANGSHNFAQPYWKEERACLVQLRIRSRAATGRKSPIKKKKKKRNYLVLRLHEILLNRELRYLLVPEKCWWLVAKTWLKNALCRGGTEGGLGEVPRAMAALAEAKDPFSKI